MKIEEHTESIYKMYLPRCTVASICFCFFLFWSPFARVTNTLEPTHTNSPPAHKSRKFPLKRTREISYQRTILHRIDVKAKKQRRTHKQKRREHIKLKRMRLCILKMYRYFLDTFWRGRKNLMHFYCVCCVLPLSSAQHNTAQYSPAQPTSCDGDFDCLTKSKFCSSVVAKS